MRCFKHEMTQSLFFQRWQKGCCEEATGSMGGAAAQHQPCCQLLGASPEGSAWFRLQAER